MEEFNKYELKTFNGGLSDYEDKGIKGSFKFGSGLDIRKRRDSLSCQQALVDEVVTDIGVSFNSLIKFFVNATDGKTYGFSDNGRIYGRFNSGKTWELSYTDADGAIKGAGLMYQDNGKTYVFWATNTKLNCREIPGAITWTDVNANIVSKAGTTYTYPKVNLTAATWHTMTIANGSLMICNYDKLAMISFDGSYTNDALSIMPTDITRTLIDRRDHLVLGTGRKDGGEDSRIYEWSQDALSYLQKVNIPTANINALIDTERLLMQVGSDGQLYYSDFNSTLPTTSFPGGGYCNPGGVCNDSGTALFGIYGSTAIDGNLTTGIYSYGRKGKNKPFTLNLEYAIDADEIGAITKVGTDILVSYKKGSNYGVKRVNTAAKATAIYQTIDLPAQTSGIEDAVVWQAVQILTKNMPTGTAIECYYRVDKDGSFVQAKDRAGATQMTAGKEGFFVITASGKIFELMLKLIPNGNNTPEVYRAVVYFK